MKTYAKHGDPNYASQTARGCELDGEPVFLLRAQDRLAPMVVRAWAAAAIDAGLPGMADEALRIADAMEQWPDRKVPD